MITTHAKSTFVPHQAPSKEEYITFQYAFRRDVDHPVWAKAAEEYGERFKANENILALETAKVVCGPHHGATISLDHIPTDAQARIVKAQVHTSSKSSDLTWVDIPPSLIRTHFETMDRVRYELDGSFEIGWIIAVSHDGTHDFLHVRGMTSVSTVHPLQEPLLNIS